ncbi:MAG TPA: type II toxin-antitoxin system RelE/ParE family toxin [archaeon]|nr:type II toxin-antitoxin system RelE/ParE family toxin [archaeon]
MAKYSVSIHKKAKEEYYSLDKTIQKRIKEKISELQEFPERGVHLIHSNFWKLRVGDYRVIYEINNSDKIVVVLYMGHRRNVYDKFSKMF